MWSGSDGGYHRSTGEIGISVTALEADDRVEKIIGMARRPFDAEHGWTKTEYRQGDILDREAVDGLVRDADVVVHLAFIVLGSREEAARVNLAGTTTVFGADRRGALDRIVYTSSVAAYGYHDDNPLPLTEETPIRGSEEHYYSAQKAETSWRSPISSRAPTWRSTPCARACIVAGPKSPALAESMPWNMLPGPAESAAQHGSRAADALPGPRRRCSWSTTTASPTRSRSAPSPSAPARAYNIAGDGTVSLGEIVGRARWSAGAVPVDRCEGGGRRSSSGCRS